MKVKIFVLSFLGLLFLNLGQVKAADEVNVTCNSTSHTVAFPFEKSFRFVATLQNNTSQKKSVQVYLPEDENKDSPSSDKFTILEAEGFYELDPGEIVEHSITFEAMMSPDQKTLSLDTQLKVEWEGGQQEIPLSVKTAYLKDQNSTENQCTTEITLKDSETQQEISGASIEAWLPSGIEFYSADSNSQTYELETPCGDYLQKVTQDYSVDHKYIGLFLNVAAKGYQFYSEANFLPQKDGSKTISLKKITQVGKYQKIGELDTGFSVWWIKASGDNKLFAISQGTHGGPGITAPSTTKITLANDQGEKVWDQEVGGECWGVDISYDGQYVAAGCHDGKIYLWDSQGNQLWTHGEKGKPNVRWVKFSSNSQYLLAGPVEDRGERAGVLEVQSGNLLWSYYADGFLREGRFSPDSQTVYAASGGGGVFSLAVESGQLNWLANGDFYIPFIFGYSDKIAVVSGKGRNFTAINLSDGSRAWQTSVDQTITAGEVAANGSVIGNSVGGMAYGLDPKGEITWMRNYGGVGHNGVWYTRNAQYVLFGGPNPTLFDRHGTVLWQREKGKEVQMSSVQEVDTGGANDTWMNEDGTLLVIGGDDGVVQFWKGQVSAGENDYSQLAGPSKDMMGGPGGDEKEIFPPPDQKQEGEKEVSQDQKDQATQPTWLLPVIIGVGVVVLVGVAIGVLVVVKRKGKGPKQSKPEQSLQSSGKIE